MRDCTAVQNFGDGILLNEGGVATGNILFLNKAFGISAFCPSSIIGNTIVSNGLGSIETKHAGCTWPTTRLVRDFKLALDELQTTAA